METARLPSGWFMLLLLLPFNVPGEGHEVAILPKRNEGV